MTIESDLSEQFQNPRIHDSWESVYPANPLQRSLNDRMMKRFLRYIQIPVAGRVLDAGCGVGDHTIRLAREGFHCVGVDISEHVLQQARRQAQALGLSSNTRFVQAGLEDLQDLDPGFDAVHCRGVLMHIPRWRAALAELCRLLKPGGRHPDYRKQRRCSGMPVCAADPPRAEQRIAPREGARRLGVP